MKVVSQFIARWIGFVCRTAPWVILGAVVLTGWFVHTTVTRLGINTSTADMIAEGLPWRQHFIDYREAFPAYQNNLVVVVDGDTPEIAALAAEGLVKELSGSELFDSVYAPSVHEFFLRHGLLFLSPEQLQETADVLADYQPVLAQLASNQTVTGFFTLLNKAIDRGLEQQLDPLIESVAEVIASTDTGRSQQLSWSELMSGEGQTPSRRQFLVLQPNLDFSTLQPARGAIEAIRGSQAASAPGVRLRLTGPVALEYEELQSVTRGVKLAGLMALGLVTLFLYLALRSWYLILAALVTLIVGLLGTATFAAFSFGNLNLISVAFAVLYVGLGIDFAIHFCLRFRELCADDYAAHEALVTAGSDVGASLTFCAVTTAAGFFSFFPTEFSGVSELGVISGVGMFVGLAATLTLLPALLAVYPKLGRSFSRLPGAPFAGAISGGNGRVIVVFTVVLTLASVLLLPWLKFDSDPINLRDPQSESVSTFLDLMDSSDALPLTLVTLVEPGDASEVKLRLSELDEVTRVVSVEDFVPTDQPEKLALLDDLNFTLGLKPQSIEQSETDEEALVAIERFLAGTNETTEPLRQTLGVWLARSDTASENPVNDLRQRLFGLLPHNIDRLWQLLDAETVTLDTLPEELSARWVAGDGRHRIEIFPKHDVRDPAVAQTFLESVRNIAPTATGMAVVNYEAGKVISNAFRLAFVYAFVVVFFLLFIWLRSLTEALIVLLPIVCAGVVTLGAMVLFGLQLNYANIIALPLLLGIGVDNGIHIMHRHLGGAAALLQTSTARAVFYSTLTTIASFGNLAFSPHLGTASMGMLLTLGMLFIMYMTLIFMPTLLRKSSL